MPLLRALRVPAAAIVLMAAAAQAQPAAIAATACASTATGDLHVERMHSRIFPGEHVLRIWLPPGYADPANAQRRYPVLYLLDGQNLFDVCPSFHQDEWQVDETLGRLIEAGKVEPLIVVGIDAPDDGALRAGEYLPYPDPGNPNPFEAHGSQFPAFLRTEVLPYVENGYRVLAGRAHTGIGGASYGAIAALNALIAAPRVFGIGLLESPWLTVGNGEFLRTSEHLAIPPLRVFIGVGGREGDAYAPGMRAHGFDLGDFNRAFAHNANVLANNLLDSGFGAAAVKFVEIPDARHTESAWRERFPAAAEYLFPAGRPAAPGP